MSKHTPGPWQVDDADDVVKDGVLVALVCGTGRTEEENRANAKLIAVAPKLLERLKVLVRTMEDEVPGAHSWIAVQAARAVIAQATA